MTKMSQEYEVINLNLDENKILEHLPHKYIWYGPNRNVCLTAHFLKIKDDILNFEVRPDDTWILTYPKTGTTWTQEMVWLLVNDLDFRGAEAVLDERSPFLECQMVIPEAFHAEIPPHAAKSVEHTKNMASPRVIKTHLPWNLLPLQIQNGTVQPKLIYVTRNPKDACVSFYNHYQIFDGFKGTLEEFCELFVTNRILYGSYFYHLKEILKRKHLPNLLMISFEAMKANLPDVIKRVAEFLNKSPSAQQIDQLTHHLSFEQMKNNPAVNCEAEIQYLKQIRGKDAITGEFINRGKVGGYKESMPEKYVEIIDNMCREFETETGFKF